MAVVLQGVKGNYSFNPFSENSKLGEGGMGLVYEGQEVHSGNKVAIKVLFKELSKNPIIVERALKESEIKFDHRNLIKMIEFIEKDGIYHIISEYLEGESLDKYLAKHKVISAEKALPIVSEVLNGLRVLHAAKPPIVHRDIKPSNIFLCQDGTIKVMDFGVARSLEETNIKLTKTGSVIGTPYYSAPEQIRSQSSLINPSTDIYSLGVTLYEMLTGSTPYEGKSEYDTLKMQVEEPLPYHSSISKDLFKVITKATAKSQKNRFSDAREFSNAIDRFIPKSDSSKRSPASVPTKWSIAKVLNFIFIPLTIFFGILLLNNIDQQNQDSLDSYYREQNLIRENGSLQEKIQLAGTNFPIIIESINLRTKTYDNKSILNDYPDKLFGGKRMVLQPKITYKQVDQLSNSLTLYYKIFDPNEKLQYRIDWKDTPMTYNVPYTNWGTIKISDSDNVIQFGGLKNYFPNGKYRIEIWYEDKCLGSKNFYLY